MTALSPPETSLKRPRRKSCLFYVLLVLTCLCLLNLLKAVPKVAGFDPAGYYAWSQALLTNHNFDPTPFVPEWTQETWFFPRTEINGHTVAINKYPIGWSLATFPFMALGQGLTWAANQYAHKNWPLDCTSALTVRLAWVGIYLWGIAGLLVASRALTRLTNVNTASFLIAVSWLGTAAFAHTWKDPGLSHGLSMALVSIVYAVAIRHIQKPTTLTKFVFGLFASWVICTRIVNIALLVPALLLMFLERGIGVATISSATDAPTQDEFLSNLRFSSNPQKIFTLLLFITLGTLPIFFLQSFAWHMNYDTWFFNGYAASGEGFAFNSQQLAGTLLTSWHGLLWRHPIVILSAIGLALALIKEKNRPARVFAGLIAFVLLLQILQYGSWRTWSDADGVRWSSDSLFLWALGLLFLARHWPAMNKPSGRLLAWSVAGVSAFLLILQIFVFKTFID